MGMLIGRLVWRTGAATLSPQVFGSSEVELMRVSEFLNGAIRLEVLAMQRVPGGYRYEPEGGPLISFEGDELDRVRELWLQLEPGDMMRCHNPEYGFRVHRRGGEEWSFSVSWACNSVVDLDERGRSLPAFDGETDAAMRLLMVLNEKVQASSQ